MSAKARTEEGSGRKMHEKNIAQTQTPPEPNPPESLLELLSAASAAGFPPAFGADKLSQLILRDVQTIFADRSRAPHKVPPACVVPGTQKPVWLLSDVLIWLATYREQASPIPDQRAAKSKTPSPGRPTKAEQYEAELLGITIRELRSRRAKTEQN